MDLISLIHPSSSRQGFILSNEVLWEALGRSLQDGNVKVRWEFTRNNTYRNCCSDIFGKNTVPVACTKIHIIRFWSLCVLVTYCSHVPCKNAAHASSSYNFYLELSACESGWWTGRHFFLGMKYLVWNSTCAHTILVHACVDVCIGIWSTRFRGVICAVSVVSFPATNYYAARQLCNHNKFHVFFING